MKKVISLMLAVLLSLSSFYLVSFAVTTATVKMDECTLYPKEPKKVPVRITNNPGIMGFHLVVEYNSEEIKPVSVSSGEVTAAGNFNDSIETSTGNRFDIIWNGSSNVYGDGIIAYIEFEGFRTSYPEVKISYVQDDTFNEDWDDVILNCRSTKLSVGIVEYLQVNGKNINKAIPGEKAKLDVEVSNFRLVTQSYNFEIENTDFTINGCYCDEADVTFTKDENNYRVFLNNISGKKSEFLLHFDITMPLQMPEKKAYRIFDEEDEVGFIHITPEKIGDSIVVSVDDVCGEVGQTVDIPVLFKNCSNLMGYKINFSYDKNVLSPVSVTNSYSGGTFATNADTAEDSFSVVWNSSSPMKTDGQVMMLKMNVLKVQPTEIVITYSAADTFNESWDDVKMICPVVYINYPFESHKHSLGEWITVKDATCTANGLKEKHCSDCDYFETETILPLGHSYSSVFTTDIVATCFNSGEKSRHCVRCDSRTDITSMNKVSHTVSDTVRENEKAASCSTAGSYDEVVYCSVCNTEMSRTQKIIAKLSHTETIVNAKTATCTEPGYTGDVVCLVCGEVITKGTTIAVLSHTASAAVRENEKAATCSAAGSYDEVVYCSVCNTEMSRTQKIIAKLSHTETTVNVKEATCSEEGYTGDVICEICGTVITQGTVIESGSGHEYGEWVIDKEATCSETGSKHRVCSACGNIETVNIPVTAHSYSTVFVPATCTDYAKDVKTCIKCGDTTESKAVARGYVYHRYVSVNGGQIYTYPTKPSTVSTIYETVTLSSQLSVVGTSTSGDRIYGNYNYGQGGNRWYLKEEINRNVNPTGHKFSEYIPDNNATCITDGTKTAVCSACGVRDTVVIENSKTAHEFNAGVVTPPTATEKGYTTYTCQREGCGYSYTDNFVWPTDEAGTKLTIETTKAKTGDEISVKLMLNNNTGIAGFAISLDYDESVLELKEAINGNLFSGFTQGKNYLWDESGDVTESGLLATLVFKVSESAQSGDYIVGATVRGCTNSKLEDVALTVDPGKITITDFEYGDANDDGVIDMKDVVLIRKYIANYDFDTETSDVETGKGADVNGDSKIDMKDVVLLRMYIANYDYDTNSSTVVLGPQ